MTRATKTDAVRFNAKGQVVLPRWLCRRFKIRKGTRAIVEATPDGILIQPVSLAIHRLHGILKRKPGDKPFAQEWAEHKAEEKALEEAKYARLTGAR